MIVKGRNIRQPVVSVQLNNNGIMLRIDDEQNAEFWLEIYLSKEELLQLESGEMSGKGKEHKVELKYADQTNSSDGK